MEERGKEIGERRTLKRRQKNMSNNRTGNEKVRGKRSGVKDEKEQRRQKDEREKGGKEEG